MQTDAGTVPKLPPFDPADPFSIPEFLRATGTPAERMAAWDAAFAKTGRTMQSAHAAMPEPKVPTDPSTLAFLAEQEEARRNKTANRIAKMKVKLEARKRHIDPVHHQWDTHRLRPCWVWSGTREPVMFNADGSAIPRGTPTQKQTTKEGASMTTAKPSKGKAPAKSKGKAPAKPKGKAPSKALAKAVAKVIGHAPSRGSIDAALTAATQKAKAGKGSRSNGVIDAIVKYIERPEGASVQEIMKFAEATFPGYTANPTTCRVYPSKAATRREKIEGRGIVFYKELAKAAA